MGTEAPLIDNLVDLLPWKIREDSLSADVEWRFIRVPVSEPVSTAWLPNSRWTNTLWPNSSMTNWARSSVRSASSSAFSLAIRTPSCVSWSTHPDGGTSSRRGRCLLSSPGTSGRAPSTSSRELCSSRIEFVREFRHPYPVVLLDGLDDGQGPVHRVNRSVFDSSRTE